MKCSSHSPGVVFNLVLLFCQWIAANPDWESEQAAEDASWTCLSPSSDADPDPVADDLDPEADTFEAVRSREMHLQWARRTPGASATQLGGAFTDGNMHYLRVSVHNQMHIGTAIRTGRCSQLKLTAHARRPCV
jgi:hypothetical protein